MLDWPNLIAGLVLGVLGTLAFWLPDRARSKSLYEREARASWTVAAKQIELAMFQPTITHAELYRLTANYPIDHWRVVLGGDDFRKLERMEGALFCAERSTTEANLRELNAAQIDFSNMSRSMQSMGYAEVLHLEDQKRRRRDYRRHPIRTWRRERHNKRVRREAGMA